MSGLHELFLGGNGSPGNIDMNIKGGRFCC